MIKLVAALLFLLFAFMVAGAIDLIEQERTTLKSYISEHTK